jgi:hypothetical protein
VSGKKSDKPAPETPVKRSALAVALGETLISRGDFLTLRQLFCAFAMAGRADFVRGMDGPNHQIAVRTAKSVVALADALLEALVADLPGKATGKPADAIKPAEAKLPLPAGPDLFGENSGPYGSERR